MRMIMPKNPVAAVKANANTENTSSSFKIVTPKTDLAAYYAHIRKHLKACGVECAELEARILIEDLWLNAGENTDKTDGPLKTLNAAIHGGEPGCIPDLAQEKIEQAIARRAQGEPLARILGYREFWKHRFLISPATLEPRPDTEILIESVLKKFPVESAEGLRILDLGTGSGCILLSLLGEYPHALGCGVDVSLDALATARTNAERLGCAARVEFVHSNWCEQLNPDSKFDVIVSNPPYIPEGEIAALERNVRDFDPILALSGGADGLDPYRELLGNLGQFLAPNGWIFFECGIGQVEKIAVMAKDTGAKNIEITKDLSGIERVVGISYGDK